MKKVMLVFLTLLACTVAKAEIIGGGGYTGGRQNLENRVSELERIVYDLHQRISTLENGGSRPPRFQEISCMVTADAYNNVYLGKGRTRLDAETTALQACANSLNASVCKKVVCDDSNRTNIRGAVCVVTAKAYNNVYKGEGTTLIEAEYKARKACETSLNGSVCNSNNPVRCETF